MVPIWWIARRPEWEGWMATGTPDHTSGFRERDLAVLLGVRTQSSRRLLHQPPGGRKMRQLFSSARAAATELAVAARGSSDKRLLRSHIASDAGNHEFERAAASIGK